MTRPHVLHLHSAFDPGGKELRSVRLMNAFARQLSHTVVSGEPDATGAAAGLNRSLKTRIQPEFPPLKGRPTPARLHRLASAMKPYDLVLTYNWGAIDAVMAHTLFKDALGLPPLIHHEDGFKEDEARRRKRRRTWYRRIALGKASGLVVPSETLEEIALVEWAQPIGRVKHIPNGIDTDAFQKPVKADAIPRLLKRKGEHWVGTMAGLRKVKNLPQLVRSFRALPENWHLVVCGEGPEREAIDAEADRLGINHRVHLPGHVADPARVMGLFDIFALSSDSEQAPLSIIEAMAAGLPVVAPTVGDIASMVSQPNVEYLAEASDGTALETQLVSLAVDAPARERVGQANRQKARDEFDERAMIATYARLYGSALGIKLKV